LFKLLVLFALLTAAACQSPAGRSAADWPTDPQLAQLIRSDVDLF
jgi:hypothetical protein